MQKFYFLLREARRHSPGNDRRSLTVWGKYRLAPHKRPELLHKYGLATYKGEVNRQGLPHGIGEGTFSPRHCPTYIEGRSLFFKDLDYGDGTYRGSWKNGEMYGQGEFETTDGILYRGFFIGFLLHGLFYRRYGEDGMIIVQRYNMSMEEQTDVDVRIRPEDEPYFMVALRRAM
jgi:hypothetical protein